MSEFDIMPQSPDAESPSRKRLHEDDDADLPPTKKRTVLQPTHGVFSATYPASDIIGALKQVADGLACSIEQLMADMADNPHWLIVFATRTEHLVMRVGKEGAFETAPVKQATAFNIYLTSETMKLIGSKIFTRLYKL
jgi:hypothetical protein